MTDHSRSAARDTPGSVSRFDGGVALSGISYDKDLYSEDKSQYLETAPGDDDEEDYEPMPGKRSLVNTYPYNDFNFKVGSYGPTREMREEYTDEGAGPPSIDALLERQDARTIRARESDYQRRGREARVLTPTRKDAFSNDSEGQSYKDIMAERELSREEDRLYRAIEEKKREGGESDKENRSATPPSASQAPATGRKRRWDVKEEPGTSTSTSQWSEDQQPAKKRSRWDQTPAAGGASAVQDTPVSKKKSRWDVATPGAGGVMDPNATPVPGVVGI